MFSVFSLVLMLSAGTAVAQPAPAPATTGQLRVCADPNNLPFSNEKREGFENELAELIAKEMGVEVSYTWWPQRRGFIRNTLRAGKCDLVMSIPSSFELAQPTRPYYRSSYVFVSRKDRNLEIRSFDDAKLKDLRIGIHLIGDDYSNVPPAEALGKRGLSSNLVGYSIYGDYSKPHPPSALIDAVGEGEIDIAIAWGPMAGYFARLSAEPLEVVPVSPEIDLPFLPFVFDISMGVRRGDDALLRRVDTILQKRAPEIRKILESYGVPLKESAIAHGRGSEVRR